MRKETKKCVCGLAVGLRVLIPIHPLRLVAYSLLHLFSLPTTRLKPPSTSINIQLPIGCKKAPAKEIVSKTGEMLTDVVT